MRDRFGRWLRILAILLGLCVPLEAQNAVPVGAGSYADSVPSADQQTDSYYGLPANQMIQFYSLLHMDPSLQGQPIPTNHWWTDMLMANRSSLPSGATQYTIQQDPYGGQMWVTPSMLAPQSYGVDVYYPNAWKAANANGSPQGNFDPGTKLPLHGDVPYHIPSSDVLIADFENGYPAGTVITGNGFASTPSTGSGLTGMMGSYCASTRDGGNGATGTLSLPAFTVTKHYLNFLVCGGNFVGGTAVELVVNGTVVLSATGVDSTTFQWVTWDISAYNGQTAQVVVVDNQTGAWGIIACDQVVESDSNNPAGRFGGDLIASNTIVTNWGDWNVDFKMPDAYGDEADFTMARGIPFTWSTWTGMNPKFVTGTSTVTFSDLNNNPITASSGSFTSGAFAFTYNGKSYGVFLPDNTTVIVGGSGSTAYFEPQLSGTNNYMVIGYLPGTSNLAEFNTYAFARPTNTALSWNYQPQNGYVQTNWTITTTPLKGSNLTTLQGWLPHHYRRTTPNFSFRPYTYQTQRGIMQVAAGNSFQINFPFSGIAPVLPAPTTQGLPNEFQQARMISYLNNFSPGTLTGETYGTGKALGLCAQYMAQAEQMGDSADFTRLQSALESALANWFTYTPGESSQLFAQYSNWHALIGFNASYGSQAFNDLHFHYGYFATATALACLYDPQFAASYGPMMKQIVKSYGNYDRTDTSEPFLRMFDVWEGHTNAGGTSSPNGENEESSSEAMQSWIGMYLLGAATNDSQMTAAGAMGYAMQSAAVNEYWEDLYNQNFPSVYGRAWAGQVWASSIVYGTYFTADPAWVYAIQYTPSNHWDNYLVKDQVSTAAQKYTASWNERTAFAAQYPAWNATTAYANGTWVNYNGSIYTATAAIAAGAAPPPQNSSWYNQGNFSSATPDVLGSYPGDYVLAYQAQFDPNTAAAEFDNYFANNEGIAKDASLSGSTYYIIHAMRDIGLQDYNYSVSVPAAAVYYNANTNVRTAVIYNPTSSQVTATVYNNGTPVQNVNVPANSTIDAPVGSAPVIVSPRTATGMVSTAFQYQIATINAATSYSATGLPSGLAVNSSTGAITGTATIAATSTVTLSAGNASGTTTAPLILTVYPYTAAPVVTSGTVTAYIGSAFTYQIAATNSPISYGATGLPAGLSLNSTTGAITGTSTASGVASVTITATNAGGTGTATLGITSLLNLALNQPATASTAQAGGAATLANDGNSSTRWVATGPTYPQWWQVDLGATYQLSNVGINWYSNSSRYYQYTIAVSTDNVNFTTVVNQSANTTMGPTSDTFAAVAGRYVKLTVTGASAGYASAYEIGVYGLPLSSTQPTVTIAATQPTATVGGASGTFTLTRTGTTVGNLPVTYAVSGTAQSGTDYAALTGTATILDGAASTTIAVNPLTGSANNSVVTLQISANANYTVGSPSQASVTISDPNTFSAWQQKYFGAQASSPSAAPGADPDGDGLVNILEYALGTDPTNGQAQPYSIAKASNHLTISFNRVVQPDPNLTITVSASNALGTSASWTPIATKTGSAAWVTTGGATVTDNAGAVVVTDGQTLDSETSRFLSISATYTGK